jgi:hypothetical protein
MTISYKNLVLSAGVALLALVSLALPFSFVKADLAENIGVWDLPSAGGDTIYPDTWSNVYPDTWTDVYPDTWTDVYPDTWTDVYPDTYSYGSESFSSPSSSFRMPSFSSPSSFSSANASARSAIASQLPSFAQQVYAPSEQCRAVNSCNVDNSYTDNSVFNAPTTVTIAQDDHSAKVIYADDRDDDDDRKERRDYDYDYPVYRQPPVYQPPYQPNYPIAYNNPAPYVTLSSLPYTGLELSPVGEVLYWAFLVLWCLAAAYLVVVKRVQNKVVGFLNGFLFGTTAGTVAHAHAAPKAAAAAAKVEPVDTGTDSFIQSQINKRS